MRTTTTLLLVALALGLLVPVLYASDEPAPPAPAPAPAPPSDAQIRALIAELGHPDFETRQRASKSLLELGEPARAALQEALKTSDDMEVRWRAEQILRRLDREGERALGQGTEERLPPTPRAGGLPPGIENPRLDELERRLDEIRRRFEESFGGFDDIERQEVLEAPGLRLTVDVWGLIPSVRLEVESRDGAGERPRVLRGRTLEELLARNPDLASQPGMKDLQAQWESFKQKNPSLFPFEGFLGRGGGFSMQVMGNGVELSQGPDGARLKITEQDENGASVTKEYEGESLDAILEAHPELRDKIAADGLGIRLGPTQLFRDRRPSPLPPVVTPSEPRSSRVFGVVLRPVEPVLASQLRLTEGQGALVQMVLPDSQAQAMGFQVYDIILGLNGQVVDDVSAATAILRRSAVDEAPLVAEVIRGGERLTLQR